MEKYGSSPVFNHFLFMGRAGLGICNDWSYIFRLYICKPYGKKQKSYGKKDTVMGSYCGGYVLAFSGEVLSFSK